LSSAAIDSLISNISILNDVLVSDHKPISFDIAGININHTEISVTVDSDVCCSVPVWSNCNDKTLAYYTSYVDHLFQYVTIPYDAVYDTTWDNVHLIDIDKFYTDICACLSKAIKDIIPCHNRLFLVVMCPVRTHVAEKHEAAREAYMVWMDMGKPRYGHYADNMRRTWATFKLALRFCINHIEELKADACAENVFKKDSGKFWNSVYKVSNKATCHAISVGAVTGP